MKHSISKFQISILLFALLAIFLAISISVSSALTVDDAPKAEKIQNDLPVIFNGVEYTYEEFKQDVGAQYPRIIFLNSSHIEGDDSGVLYAFTNTGDLTMFASENGVMMTSGSPQPDILPTEIQANE